MENVLRGLSHTVVYLDDILITGKDDVSHLKNLREVLSRLKKAGFKLKKEKCSFMVPSVTYLGYKIDAEGVHPVQDKVKAIQEAPAPKNVNELKAYIELLNYYHNFLPNLSSEIGPLYTLVRKDCKWKWTELEQETFQTSKRPFSVITTIGTFRPN